ADVITPGSCVHRYTIARTYVATDACGNSASQTQTITVDDETPPVISCPNNVTINCQDSQNPSVNNSLGKATATDNCSGTPTITYTDATTAGNCAGNYIITRTWMAADICGNSSTCNQVITVHDVTPPVLHGVPSNATVDCNTVPAAVTPTATDNCDAS